MYSKRALVVATACLAGCAGPDGPWGAAADVRLTSIPERTAPSSTFEVCWHVEGVGTTQHTDLHVSNESRTPPPAGGVGLHDGESVYPQNAPRPDPSGYDLPSTFCATLSMPSKGSLFVVAHATDDQHDEHRVSDERQIRAS